jgi:regulator of extracellular matrix RemA (YlzA/DUF370 family)
MARFVNIGFGNMIATSKIVAIVSPDSAPIRRMIQDSKERVIDATCGRRTRAVIITDNAQIVLSSVLPETIFGRLKEQGDIDLDEQ